MKIAYPPKGAFHRDLQERVDAYFDATGLDRRDDPRALVKAVVMVGWAAASYVALLFVATGAWQVAGAALSLALAGAGIPMALSHDGLHQAMSRRRWVNEAAGWASVLVGLNPLWWRYKHNVLHHGYTNIDGVDDDLDLHGIARFSPGQHWQPHHQWQWLYMWLLYPLLHIAMMFTADASFVVTSSVAGRRFAVPVRQRAAMLAGKLLGWTLLFALPLALHPWPAVLLVFVCCSAVIGVALSVVFQLEHCVEGLSRPTDRACGRHGRQGLGVEPSRGCRRRRLRQPLAHLVYRRAELPRRAPPVPVGVARPLPGAGADRAGGRRGTRAALRRVPDHADRVGGPHAVPAGARPAASSRRGAHSGGMTAAAFLRGIDIFRAVPDDVLADVAAASSRVSLPAGATLFSEGDSGDSLYAVVSGRLRVLTTSGAARDVGRGHALGELALLLGGVRTATVKAVRDTEVIQVPASVLDLVAERSPRVLLDVAALVADRLTSSEQSPAAARVRTVAVLHVDRAHTGDVLAGLPGLHVSAWPDGVDEGRLGEWLDDQEAAHPLVVLDADAVPAFLGHADVVLVVAAAAASPGLGHVAASLPKRDAAPPAELVLVHAPPSSQPRRTAAWLALAGFTRHHHVVAPDVSRLARHLLGQSVGLVLSGGGARAFAHIGVVRALREAGVPIDRIGGSSIGSVVGAQVAAGWTPERMLAVNDEEWNKHRIDREYTLPAVSLLSTRRARKMFDRMFGELSVEDLWLDSYFTVVNLTTCALEVRRRGSVAEWVRASASPPGLWPPVVDEAGHLFIDGGVLDNVPTALMDAGVVITSNVSPPDDMSVAPGAAAPDGIGDAVRLLARRRPPFPSIGKIIYRTAVVTSLSAQAAAQAASDIYIEPPVREYGLTAYRDIPTLERLGYDAARATLTTTGSLPPLPNFER